MTSDNLSALIARLEAGTQSSREVDARICIALGLSRDNVMVGADGWCINSATNPGPYKSPPYTGNVDAAIMLVPTGWSWRVSVSENRLHPVVKLGRSYPTNATVAQEAATPALALCIASLRARMTTTAPTGEHTTS